MDLREERSDILQLRLVELKWHSTAHLVLSMMTNSDVSLYILEWCFLTKKAEAFAIYETNDFHKAYTSLRGLEDCFINAVVSYRLSNATSIRMWVDNTYHLLAQKSKETMTPEELCCMAHLMNKEGDMAGSLEYYQVASERNHKLATLFMGLSFFRHGNEQEARRYLLRGVEMKCVKLTLLASKVADTDASAEQYKAMALKLDRLYSERIFHIPRDQYIEMLIDEALLYK